MHDKKLGRNPFEKKSMNARVASAKAEDTVLFQDVVKPQSDIEKFKEMQIQIDWNELYRSLTKGLTRLFIFVSFIYLTGCASGAQQQAELRKHIVELQKTVAKQSGTIEELNNKIYLLSDRVDHYSENKNRANQPTAPLAKQNAEIKPGDLQIYELAIKDLKSKSFEGFLKKVELLAKGYKNSPLTNNALYLLGEHYYQNKNYLEASKVFERLYSMAPDGNKAVAALYMLGLNYQKQNRNQEAKEAYQTVINVYPGSREALESSKQLSQLTVDNKK